MEGLGCSQLRCGSSKRSHGGSVDHWSRHYDEEQDSDPEPHYSEKRDPDQN
jgi:hypothetical protein